MKSIKIIILLVSFFMLAGFAGMSKAETKIMTENEQVISKEKIVKFKCKGIGCTGCTNTITEAVKKLDGIKEVSSDVKTKMIEVTFDSEIVSEKQIEKAINDSGYETETVN